MVEQKRWSVLGAGGRPVGLQQMMSWLWGSSVTVTWGGQRHEDLETQEKRVLTCVTLTRWVSSPAMLKLQVLEVDLEILLLSFLMWILQRKTTTDSWDVWTFPQSNIHTFDYELELQSSEIHQCPDSHAPVPLSHLWRAGIGRHLCLHLHGLLTGVKAPLLTE